MTPEQRKIIDDMLADPRPTSTVKQEDAIKALRSAHDDLAAKLERAQERLQAMSDTAYSAMIAQAKRTECLGWEIKAQRGQFGKAEFEAHEKRCELYGRHLGLAQAIRELDAARERAGG